MVKANVTTSIDIEVHRLAIEKGISWSRALDFGIRFISADADGFDYPDCNLQLIHPKK
jgi:hypothetical protein